MNTRLIRFHRPNLRGLMPQVIAIPCTNLTVSLHHDTHGAARWQHAPYADGSGGEIRLGRWTLIYGVDGADAIEDPAWASSEVAA
jgi:hypothetical protein